MAFQSAFGSVRKAKPPNNFLKDIVVVIVEFKAVMDILSAKGICSSLKSHLIPFINVN